MIAFAYVFLGLGCLMLGFYSGLAYRQPIKDEKSLFAGLLVLTIIFLSTFAAIVIAG
jgi:hypothetical protein